MTQFFLILKVNGDRSKSKKKDLYFLLTVTLNYSVWINSSFIKIKKHFN